MPSLIELQLDVLLSRDGQGRLIATRDPGPRPAPRLFLGRSRDGNVWAVRRDVERATGEALARLCAAEPAIEAPRADRAPACRERVQDLLGPFAAEHRGPAYLLPAGLPRDRRAREVEAYEAPVWARAFPWLVSIFDAVVPVVIAFADGQAAAVCHAPRGCTAWAAEAGVETLPSFRGRGLAVAAVACWARAVQRTGRLALYSTSWENVASQAVARRLSARPYGEDWHVT